MMNRFDLPYTDEEMTMWLLQNHDTEANLLETEIHHNLIELGQKFDLVFSNEGNDESDRMMTAVRQKYHDWLSHVARTFPGSYEQCVRSHETNPYLDNNGQWQATYVRVIETRVGGVLIRVHSERCSEELHVESIDDMHDDMHD